MSLILGIGSALWLDWWFLVFLIALTVISFLPNLKQLMFIPLSVLLGFITAHLNLHSLSEKDQRPYYQASLVKCRVLDKTVRLNSIKYTAKITNHQDQNLIGTRISLSTRDHLQMEAGDEVLIHTELSTFQSPSVPYQFDYGEYFNNKGFYYQAFINSTQVLKIGEFWSLMQYVVRLRAYLWKNLEATFDDSEESNIIRALVIGDKGGISFETKDKYATAGIMHILAVSGLHVGIAYLLISFLIKRLQQKHWQVVVLLGLLFLYAGVTGFSPSVIRASVMFAIFGLAQLFGYQRSSVNVLLSATYLILLVNPNYLFEAGFQLSVSAVLGILFFHGPIEGLLQIKSYWPQKIWSLAAVSIAAQILASPLAMYYFHLFPTYFILINVIVVLLVQFALVGGMFSAVFGDFLGIYQVSSWVAIKSCSLINQLTDVVSEWPWARISGIHLSVSQVVLLYGVIFSIYGMMKLRVHIFQLSAALFMFLFLGFAAVRFHHTNQQHYIAFHTIKGLPVIELVKGKTSVLYYHQNKLNDHDISFYLDNYHASMNISRFHQNEMKDLFCLGGVFFSTLGPEPIADYSVKMHKRGFWIQDRHGQRLFDSRSKSSHIIPFSPNL